MNMLKVQKVNENEHNTLNLDLFKKNINTDL